jgi:hypothetical protein
MSYFDPYPPLQVVEIWVRVTKWGGPYLIYCPWPFSAPIMVQKCEQAPKTARTLHISFKGSPRNALMQ